MKKNRWFILVMMAVLTLTLSFTAYAGNEKGVTRIKVNKEYTATGADFYKFSVKKGTRFSIDINPKTMKDRTSVNVQLNSDLFAGFGTVVQFRILDTNNYKSHAFTAKQDATITLIIGLEEGDKFRISSKPIKNFVGSDTSIKPGKTYQTWFTDMFFSSGMECKIPKDGNYKITISLPTKNKGLRLTTRYAVYRKNRSLGSVVLHKDKKMTFKSKSYTIKGLKKGDVLCIGSHLTWGNYDSDYQKFNDGGQRIKYRLQRVSKF